MKVIIVGGVAGGATAAARIRRLDEHAEITVFERSGYISYANCGLPYYIGDVITDPEELTLQTPESFFKRFRINMKIHHEVISIHPDRKTVSVKNLENGEIFDCLLYTSTSTSSVAVPAHSGVVSVTSSLDVYKRQILFISSSVRLWIVRINVFLGVLKNVPTGNEIILSI